MDWDGLSGGEGNGATTRDGTDVETATARAEDGGARVAGARCQGGAGWRNTEGAEGGFGRGTARGRRPETAPFPTFAGVRTP